MNISVSIPYAVLFLILPAIVSLYLSFKLIMRPKLCWHIIKYMFSTPLLIFYSLISIQCYIIALDPSASLLYPNASRFSHLLAINEVFIIISLIVPIVRLIVCSVVIVGTWIADLVDSY